MSLIAQAIEEARQVRNGGITICSQPSEKQQDGKHPRKELMEKMVNAFFKKTGKNKDKLASESSRKKLMIQIFKDGFEEIWNEDNDEHLLD